MTKRSEPTGRSSPFVFERQESLILGESHDIQKFYDTSSRFTMVRIIVEDLKAFDPIASGKLFEAIGST
jgi:hypothetical protein